MNSKILLSSVASMILAISGSAMEFQVLGSKAASMGGAGIAMSPSSLSAYNNPALLGQNKEKISIHLGAGVGLKDTGIGKSVSDLNDIGFSDLINKADGAINDNTQITSNDLATLAKARDIVTGMDQKGFNVTPEADFSLAYKNFGLGLFITSDIGGYANIDQTHNALIFQGNDNNYYEVTSVGGVYGITGSTSTAYNNSSLAYAVQNGTTNIHVVGLAVGEIPLAYGHAFDTGYGSLSVGGAMKLMSGQTFSKTVKVDDDNSLDNLDQNTKKTTTYGVDLGLAFKPLAAEGLTLAMVGKNLNSPKFDIATAAGGGSYTLDPMVRAGVAYQPNSWIELAFDADLTKNKSITMYDTQYVGGGVNFDLKVLEFNVGLMQNIASNDTAGLIYTAGIATGPDWLHFELSAQMASKTGEVDGTQYPKQAMVNFALSSSW